MKLNTRRFRPFPEVVWAFLSIIGLVGLMEISPEGEISPAVEIAPSGGIERGGGV
ncbi:hypothetical protein ADIS_3689 [Lunatimonas lonarensis]|uniref:Uncharacterized protein n=1 Tax=Lunatimonas lonarensis TaxID=1232681 RepID=R7ZP16_9BACT|nr:hypothetical protein ADIS_3689 [Lunatimonas lonarensis]